MLEFRNVKKLFNRFFTFTYHFRSTMYTTKERIVWLLAASRQRGLWRSQNLGLHVCCANPKNAKLTLKRSRGGRGLVAMPAGE